MTTSKLLDMNTVKASRQEQAAATRQRILDTAYDLFCELGYRGTTMTLIAERAGVAVQTVYFTFRTKDALLQEVHNQTVLGRGTPLVPMQQPWYIAALAESDPIRTTQVLVEGLATILGRVAPMLPVFHAVVADPAGEVYRQAEALRRPAMYDVAREVLLAKGPARPGVDAAYAGDLLVVLLGPEIYRMYVLELGWSRERWVDWTTQILVRELFDRS
jgi:AcrR family transcriptional regulator